MKKSMLIALLGIAVAASSSYAQGYIYFSSYVANGTGVQTLDSSNGNAPIGSSYQAQLLFSLTPISDSVNTALASSIISDPNASLTAITSSLAQFDNTGLAVGATGLGYFDGTTAANGSATIIPGYAGGNVYLEVIAFNGSTYDTSTSRGRSGIFIESGLPTSSGVPAATFANYPSSFFVASVVPEPTTLALAGLGGLASLVAFRRKQA